MTEKTESENGAKHSIDALGDDLQELRNRIDRYMQKIERSQAQMRMTEEAKTKKPQSHSQKPPRS